LPASGLTIAWPDADQVEDAELMTWRERSLTFLVRVIVGEDNHVRADIRIAEDDRPTVH
jgi:hypothetical protein